MSFYPAMTTGFRPCALCEDYSDDLPPGSGYCHAHLRSLSYWGEDVMEEEWGQKREAYIAGALRMALERGRLDYPFDAVRRVGPGTFPRGVFEALCAIAEETREDAWGRLRMALAWG